MHEKRIEDNTAAVEAHNTSQSPTDLELVQFHSLDPDDSRIERLALAFVRYVRKATPSLLLVLGDLVGLVAAGQIAIWSVRLSRQFVSSRPRMPLRSRLRTHRL